MGVSAHQARQLVSGRDWRGALGSVSGRLMPSKLRPPVESGVGGHLDWEKPEAGLGLNRNGNLQEGEDNWNRWARGRALTSADPLAK